MCLQLVGYVLVEINQIQIIVYYIISMLLLWWYDKECNCGSQISQLKEVWSFGGDIDVDSVVLSETAPKSSTLIHTVA